MENKTKVFETDRLILRKLELADAEDMFKNYCGSETVTKYLSWNAHKSLEDTKQYLEKFALPRYNDNPYIWAIVLKETNEVIGCIDVVKIDLTKKSVELGWVLSEKYWGQGLMPEAGMPIRDYLFEEGFVRIWARHNIANKKSGRVMQKIGMIYEGTQRKADLDNQGNFIDLDIYAITK